MDLIVRLVGYPTEETMPGWHLLPFARTFLKNDPYAFTECVCVCVLYCIALHCVVYCMCT